MSKDRNWVWDPWTLVVQVVRPQGDMTPVAKACQEGVEVGRWEAVRPQVRMTWC